MKNRWINFSLAVVSCAFLAGCGNDAPSPDVLAEVDDAQITESAYRYWWSRTKPPADSPGTRAKLLEDLIARAARVRAAREAGLDRDPVVVTQIESLLIGRLNELELKPKLDAVQVTEAEVHAFYDAHQTDRFTVPARARLAVLWFNTRGQDPLVQRYTPRLQAICEEIESIPVEQGFGQHSRKNSEHRTSRLKGGDIGWIESVPYTDAWKSAVQVIAGSLQEPGELSPLVANKHGLFLVRLIEREPARIREYEKVKERIEHRLYTDHRAEVEAQFNQAIQNNVSVRKYPEALSALSGLQVREDLDRKFTPRQLTSRRQSTTNRGHQL